MMNCFIANIDGTNIRQLTPYTREKITSEENQVIYSTFPFYCTLGYISYNNGDSNTDNSTTKTNSIECEIATQIDSKSKTYTVEEINGFKNTGFLTINDCPVIPYVKAGETYMISATKDISISPSGNPFNVAGGRTVITDSEDANVKFTIIVRNVSGTWTLEIIAPSLKDSGKQGGFVTVEVPSSTTLNEKVAITFYVNDSSS